MPDLDLTAIKARAIARVRVDAAAKIDETHTLLRQSQAESARLAARVAELEGAIEHVRDLWNPTPEQRVYLDEALAREMRIKP